jgi:hypothetical protein
MNRIGNSFAPRPDTRAASAHIGSPSGAAGHNRSSSRLEGRNANGLMANKTKHHSAGEFGPRSIAGGGRGRQRVCESVPDTSPTMGNQLLKWEMAAPIVRAFTTRVTFGAIPQATQWRPVVPRARTNYASDISAAPFDVPPSSASPLLCVRQAKSLAWGMLSSFGRARPCPSTSPC